MVNFHIEHGKESMDSIRNPTDSMVMMQTLECLKVLAKLGIEVRVDAGGISAEMTSRATVNTTDTHHCLGGIVDDHRLQGLGSRDSVITVI